VNTQSGGNIRLTLTFLFLSWQPRALRRIARLVSDFFDSVSSVAVSHA
jgi:hypothetical protein